MDYCHFVTLDLIKYSQLRKKKNKKKSTDIIIHEMRPHDRYRNITAATDIKKDTLYFVPFRNTVLSQLKTRTSLDIGISKNVLFEH